MRPFNDDGLNRMDKGSDDKPQQQYENNQRTTLSNVIIWNVNKDRMLQQLTK